MKLHCSHCDRETWHRETFGTVKNRIGKRGGIIRRWLCLLCNTMRSDR